jgi:hypothetical protein
MVPDDVVFNLSYQPAYGSGSVGFANGAVTVTRIKITEQSAGNKSYKTHVPTIVEQAGYTSSEVDQTFIDAHADEFSDPEMGWLITKNESADQVLFRLAGSLFGYVWHGLDGKVRSKKLEAPGEVADPFVIDSTRANPSDIVAYDDPAPNLRRSVNALRNWQPIPLDKTAGITTTWTEEDRAKVTQDWRITRVWDIEGSTREGFNRRWPSVASREPFATALRDADTATEVANLGPSLWAQKPKWFEIPTVVRKGELADVAVGETVKAELDYPGLENTWLLVLGRSGTATPGVVTLTCWSAKETPVPLLIDRRADPRIALTRGSVATRFDEGGVLEEVAADVLRADYAPDTLAFRGWLSEHEATNELLDNRDLTTGNWSGVNGGTAARDAVGLDGKDNAASTVSGTAQNSFMTQTVTVPADTNTHQAYIYVKKGQSTACEFRIILGGVNRFVRVDTTTGGIVLGTGEVHDAGDWYRVDLETDGDGSDTAMLVRVFNDRSGNNVSQVVDFGQVELNTSFPTSPIAVGSNSVTRSADDASISGTDFSGLWSATEGTIIVEVEPQYADDATILDASDGTANNRLFLSATSGSYQYRIIDGGTSKAADVGGSVTAGEKTRLVLAYKENDIAFYQDGALIGTSSSATIPAVSQLEWGQGFRFAVTAYYPRRLPDDELEEVSTLNRNLILDPV